MIEIRKATMEDAELVCPNAVEQELRDGIIDWRSWARFNLDTGPAYAGLMNGEVVGIGGVRLLENRKGEVWFAMTEDAQKYKFSGLRTIRMMLVAIIKEFELVTLLTFSRKGFTASQRLLNHLGFQVYQEDNVNFYYKLEV